MTPSPSINNSEMFMIENNNQQGAIMYTTGHWNRNNPFYNNQIIEDAEGNVGDDDDDDDDDDDTNYNGNDNDWLDEIQDEVMCCIDKSIINDEEEQIMNQINYSILQAEEIECISALFVDIERVEQQRQANIRIETQQEELMTELKLNIERIERERRSVVQNVEQVENLNHYYLKPSNIKDENFENWNEIIMDKRVVRKYQILPTAKQTSGIIQDLQDCQSQLICYNENKKRKLEQIHRTQKKHRNNKNNNSIWFKSDPSYNTDNSNNNNSSGWNANTSKANKIDNNVKYKNHKGRNNKKNGTAWVKSSSFEKSQLSPPRNSVIQQTKYSKQDLSKPDLSNNKNYVNHKLHLNGKNKAFECNNHKSFSNDKRPKQSQKNPSTKPTKTAKAIDRVATSTNTTTNNIDNSLPQNIKMDWYAPKRHWCRQFNNVNNTCRFGLNCRFVHVHAFLGPILNDDTLFAGNFSIRINDYFLKIKKEGNWYTGVYDDRMDNVIYFAERGPNSLLNNHGVYWYPSREDVIQAIRRVLIVSKYRLNVGWKK